MQLFPGNKTRDFIVIYYTRNREDTIYKFSIFGIVQKPIHEGEIHRCHNIHARPEAMKKAKLKEYSELALQKRLSVILLIFSSSGIADKLLTGFLQWLCFVAIPRSNCLFPM